MNYIEEFSSSHRSDFRHLPLKVNRSLQLACALCAVLMTACAVAREEVAAAEIVCERQWQLKQTHPHDSTDFTQGLVVVNGRLFESTGQYGRSSIHELERHSGRKLRSAPVTAQAFAEGLSYSGGRLVQLSWREETAWVYDLDLRLLATLRYPGEGWGLTTMQTPDGERLVLSDGTPWLQFLRPDTLAKTGRVMVRLRDQPVQRLNELEALRGEILANIWHSDQVAVIDPASGAVRGWFDFSPLRSRLVWPDGQRPAETDLNGLAWDERTQRLIVTGKYWPALFEVEIGGCKGAAKDR